MMEENGERKLVEADVNELVRPYEEWLEHIKDPHTQLSHRIFTAESHWRGFWEVCGHSVFLVDETFRIIDANPYACKHLHTTLANLTEKRVQDLIPDFRFEADLVNIQTVVDGNASSSAFDSAIKNSLASHCSIPVRVVASRVPYHPQRNFRFMIVHVYELPAIKAQPQDTVKNMGWLDILKHCLITHPVGVCATLLAALFFTVVACQGNFAEFITNIIRCFH